MNIGEPAILTRTFFEGSADEVAKNLIGVSIFVNGIGGAIVETEAYDEGDPASHCSDGEPTALNESMFLAGGHAYVCPGRHMLNLNLTCGPRGFGSAILIRALRPSPDSVEVMTLRAQEVCALSVDKSAISLQRSWEFSSGIGYRLQA